MEHLKIIVVVFVSLACIECRPTHRNGVVIQEEITDVPSSVINNKEEVVLEPYSEPKGSPIDAVEVVPSIQENPNAEIIQQEREDYTLEFPNLIKSQKGYSADLLESSNEDESQLISDRLLKSKNKVCFDTSILKSSNFVSVLRKIISRDLHAEIMKVTVEEMAAQNHQRK